MKALTGRQLEILNFVRTYSMENGCPPTIRECASHFNISLGAIQCHFAALQKKGIFLNQTSVLVLFELLWMRKAMNHLHLLLVCHF